MIHGLGGTSNMWTPVLPALARHGACAPTCPARAARTAWRGRCRSRASCEAMLRVLRRAGAGARARGGAFAGDDRGAASGGGRAAAGAEPRAVRAAALPARRRPGPALRARGEKARAEGRRACRRSPTRWCRASTSAETRTRRPVAVAFVRESLMRQCPDGYARTCEALADAAAGRRGADRAARRSWSPATRTPSRRPRRCGRSASASPARRVEVLPRCGHWTTVEKPEECADLLRRFYAQRM